MKKKFLVNKPAWCLLALLSQIIILLMINAAGQLSFAVNDDTTMVALAGGGYGSPSQYIINMHMVVGYLLKWLFTIYNDINWVTIFYLFVYFAAVFLLDVIFALRSTKGTYYFCSIVIVDLVFMIVISYFTFTVAAYWSGMVGLLALTDASCRQKGRQRTLLYTAGGFVLALCALVRGETLKSLLIVYLAVAVCAWILDKNKRPAAIMMCALCLIPLSSYTNLWMVNMNPVQKEFFQWGELRSAALDCAAVPYSEELNAQGMSAGQYLLIYAPFYHDRDVINEETLQLLIDMNEPLQKYNVDVAGFIQSHFTFNGNIKFEFFYRILFTITLLFYFIFGEKRKRGFLLLIWLMTVGTEFIFYFLRRSPYRVIMPNYLMAVLFIVWYCHLDQNLTEWLAAQGISVSKMVLAFTLVLGVVGGNQRVFNYSYNGYMPYLFTEGRQKLLEYVDNHSEYLFLAGGAEAYNIHMSRPVLDHCGRHNGGTIIGNWETYSVPFLKLMQNKGIEDPYHVLHEAVNNPYILLITRHGDGFPNVYSWVLDLIQERYGLTADFVKVDDISTVVWDDMVIETWVSYKLVC